MRNLDVELKKLIEFANNNDSIRGLILQGSYVNDNAPKDIFSDLDPFFYVTDINKFINEFTWKNNFGEVISYFHDEWDSQENQKTYSRLTIYKDGFKMDFGFGDISLAKYANDMALYKIYVDKDNVIPEPEVIDEQKFFIKKPQEKEYQDILRDFFFDSSYVVKTIYRDEIMFNQYMIQILHKKIQKLVEWYIGCKYDFKVNTGVVGRYMKRYLSKDEYQLIKDTYSGTKPEETKQALLKSFEAVHYFGEFVARRLDFTYPQKHEDDMYDYCLSNMNKF